MSPLKRNLRLIGAFAALATLALAASCHGFFVKPTLTAIAISPSAPQVQQGQTLQLQVFGTFDDGTRNQVKSGLNWTSASPGVATIDTNTGILSGVATGTSSITADAQGLTATATATVFLSISSISISPTSNTVSSSAPALFTVKAVSGGTTIDISSAATLTPEINGQVQSTIVCSFDSVSGQQSCTENGATAGTVYQIVASYSGSTLTATATLTAQ